MDTPDRATLSDLYEGQQKSLREIGAMYGVAATQVRRWLVRASISTRSVSEGTSLATKGKPKSEEHRKKLAINAAKARAARTPEGYARPTLRGRSPANKGESWSDETRAKHSYRQTDEYRESQAVRQRGELGPNWQGGKVPLEQLHLSGWPWRLRRQECYERDNWTCQDCGCKCLNTRDSKLHPKRKIQAHHLVARRHGGGDELENLVTLCMSCHHKRERADATGVTG